MKLDIKETQYEAVGCDHLVQDRVKWRGFCEHGNEPSGSIGGWGVSTSSVTVRFSRRILPHVVTLCTCMLVFCNMHYSS
jgi:hypothetical protein